MYWYGGVVESVPNDCGMDSGFGFNVRPLIVASIDAVSIDPVCSAPAWASARMWVVPASAVWKTWMAMHWVS